MLRFAFISEYDSETGKARVSFSEDGIVSAWLPIARPGAQDTKVQSPLAVGEQAACLMDEKLERGVILGATYNQQDAPAEQLRGPKISGVVYSDGSYSVFDAEGGSYERTAGEASLKMSGNLFSLKNDQETLKGLIDELLDALIAETHPTPSGPSGPPSNLATYQALKTKFASLMEE